jgi:CDP-glucose 4,6-dehydratase
MKTNNFEWNNQRVLVTGASGFIGSWLCRVLTALGAKVYGATRHQIIPLSAYSVLELNKKISIVDADISDQQQVLDMINFVNPQIIFHLAAEALVPATLRDPRRAFEVNLMGTINIIEACRRLGVCKNLLISSTDHVFGRFEPKDLPKNGFCEADGVGLGGPYDTSKAAMELAVRSYHYTYWHELPSIGITRCANVFGYGDVNPRRVIPLFVNWALNDHTIYLKYKENGRQFIHVADAVAGLILAMAYLDTLQNGRTDGNNKPEHRSPFTPTFHFAIESYDETNDPFIRMDHLADLIASIFGSSVNQEDSIQFAPNENKIQALNCYETKQILGWRTKKTFRDSIEKLGTWYSEKDIDLLKKLIENEIEDLIRNLANN